MDKKIFEINTALQIGKPADEVFEAIVDPQKMSQYFISEGSGRMEEGSEVMWKFPEFEVTFPVRVIEVIRNKSVSFKWDHEDRQHLVKIELKTAGEGSAVVTVTETGGEPNESGIMWLKQNTAGWANFLACMKAFLEHGINLRKGGFDFMRES